MMCVWVSYSKSDGPFAKRLMGDLRDAGLDVLSAEEILKPGDSIVRNVSQAIERADVVLILLSRRSVESQWVSSEVAFAISGNLRRGKPVLIPVMTEGGVEVPPLLADRAHADLSRPKGYDSGFSALVRRLKDLSDVGTPPPPEPRESEVAFLSAQLHMLRMEVAEAERVRVITRSRIGLVLTVSLGLTLFVLLSFVLVDALNRTVTAGFIAVVGLVLGVVLGLLFSLLGRARLLAPLARVADLFSLGRPNGEPRDGGLDD